MAGKIRRWLEEGSWDEEMIKQEKLLNWFCWLALLVAAILFSPAVYKILSR